MSTLSADAFAPARAVANAVLYEGYLLFPYTASSAKNRVRWQFGVVVPRAYLAAGTGETAEQRTDVLVEAEGDRDPELTLMLRFLQVEARQVEVRDGDGYDPVESLTINGTRHLSFDEGAERELRCIFTATPRTTVEIPIAIPGGRDTTPLPDGTSGRIVRERWPLRGTFTLSCDPVAGAPSLRRVTAVVANDSDVVAGERAGALRTAFVSTHLLLAAEQGTFLSVLDPPESAAAASRMLKSRHTFPVLAGAQHDPHRSALMLSSPIILYDFPAVAAQTDVEQFDGTEIDELLTLSVLSLPDAERDEARATDPRARAIVERAERFGRDEMERVHSGTMHLLVDGVKVMKGAAVRLRPKRRADAWDMFLEGRDATVRAIHQDFEGVFYVAVTVDDDPASDLHEWYGRSFFFYPDEIEPLEPAR
ncbi:MAG TPA: hypothetical protein VGN14_09910 [Candidatus Elarobacter sp.]